MTREESLKSSLAKTEEKHCHHDCCKKSDDDHKDCQHDCHHHHHDKKQKQQYNRKRNGCALCGLMQIMNPFPVSGNVDDYEPTKFEEAMNVLTHLLPIAVFAYFSNRMFVENLVNSSEEMFVALVFCIGMCILFLVSSTYHLVCLIYGKNHPNVDFFRSMDYATIYIFIGASYTPWLSLVPLGEDGTYGKGMAVLVWSIAVIGLIKSYNPKFLPQIESVVLLNLMGWVAIIIIPPALFTHVPIEAFIFLLIGGIFYSGGCFILKYGDGRIPAAHAIWHMLVNCGVLFHFLVMEVYLINLDTHFRPGEEMPLMVYEQVIEAWNSNRTWHFPGINVLYR